MKFELTRAELEELATCIALNQLDPDEACEYALGFAIECQGTAEVIVDVLS